LTTIRDVAKRAQVAPITVSRVINASGYVSDKTRERVLAAVDELGYVPNTLARSLRLKKTHTLALALTDITNPFWTTVARGVEDAAHAAGFVVVLCNTDESESKQNEYLSALVQQRVDGILLVPARSDAKAVKWVQGHSTPIVVLDRRVPHTGVDVVRGDSEQGAYRLVQHLISLGHRQIAALSGPQDVSTSRDRVAGFCRAMAEAELEIRPEWIRYGHFSQDSGLEMTRELYATEPVPTALFGGNNFIAIGALRVLRELGLRVPGDVSVVSFDDPTSDLVIEPFLTVADQPAYEMGRQATDLLLSRLSGSAPAGYREIVLPSRIIVRQSSGKSPTPSSRSRLAVGVRTAEPAH
jgi:LacI family transcriptional regulator, galactose operon repressor